ncbi:MAG: hypothetical protein DI564_18230, partial [Rhodanobacter denitrificans]
MVGPLNDAFFFAPLSAAPAACSFSPPAPVGDIDCTPLPLSFTPRACAMSLDLFVLYVPRFCVLPLEYTAVSVTSL